MKSLSKTRREPGIWLTETDKPDIGPNENRAECLFALLKPYRRVLRGISQCNLPGYVGFFPCLRNFRQQNAFEQAELILRAA